MEEVSEFGVAGIGRRIIIVKECGCKSHYSKAVLTSDAKPVGVREITRKIVPIGIPGG